MKRVRKRHRTLAELYNTLSRSTVWIIFTFLILISYVTETRPSINSFLGIYAGGLLDGILITTLVTAIVFYYLSRTAR